MDVSDIDIVIDCDVVLPGQNHNGKLWGSVSSVAFGSIVALLFFEQELTKETEIGALGFASISGSKCNPDLVHHETHQIHESPARLDHVPSSVSWLIPTC